MYLPGSLQDILKVRPLVWRALQEVVVWPRP
jgi:hypothetical protein